MNSLCCWMIAAAILVCLGMACGEDEEKVLPTGSLQVLTPSEIIPPPTPMPTPTSGGLAQHSILTQHSILDAENLSDVDAGGHPEEESEVEEESRLRKQWIVRASHEEDAWRARWQGGLVSLRERFEEVYPDDFHDANTEAGKLMEAIIESVDEFYSENLAQEVTRGMREAASRGFFLSSKAPFGYKRIKVNDGSKERPTLVPDLDAAPIVREVFESSLRGNGLKEICRELNDRGITNKGYRWHKGGLHYLLTNEVYTGTAVWGKTTKGEQSPDPVRVENAWPALVSRELFDSVQQALHERAPTVQGPARVGNKFLLSGLLRCGHCGRPFTGQGAKSGQFAYYVCGTLHREGAGVCQARYLNAPRVEGFVVEKIKERILTDETITELVTLVAEEVDAMAGEFAGRLKVIEAELADVVSRLERLYEALETSQLTLGALSPRILNLRHRQDQLTAARDEAESQLEQRRVELPGTEEIKEYVADFRSFLEEGTFPERKALIRNFVQGIEVMGDEATLTYTIPMPSDGVTHEGASVLDFVQSGPPHWTKSRTFTLRVTLAL